MTQAEAQKSPTAAKFAATMDDVRKFMKLMSLSTAALDEPGLHHFAMYMFSARAYAGSKNITEPMTKLVTVCQLASCQRRCLMQPRILRSMPS